MKQLTYNVLIGITTVAVVEMLAAHGVGGWRLGLLCIVLLIIYFRPRGDAEACRERRIERESDQFAGLLLDTMDVLERGSAKVIEAMHERAPERPHDIALRQG